MGAVTAKKARMVAENCSTLSPNCASALSAVVKSELKREMSLPLGVESK